MAVCPGERKARQELRLAAAIEKLDKYHPLALDVLSYVQNSQAMTSVLFKLISARYERRSMILSGDCLQSPARQWTTANQPFGACDSVFPDPAVTVAAIDVRRAGLPLEGPLIRLTVHHAIILEMNTDSYRRKSAQARAASSNAAQTSQPK